MLQRANGLVEDLVRLLLEFGKVVFYVNKQLLHLPICVVLLLVPGNESRLWIHANLLELVQVEQFLVLVVIFV